MKTRTLRPRPLLLASAGLGFISMATGCFIAGNLVALPRCTDAGVPKNCVEYEDGKPCVDAGVPSGCYERPYCTDAGVPADCQAVPSKDGGTDGG